MTTPTRKGEKTVGTLARILATCVACAALGLFATGIERIVWMFGNGGLVAEIPRKLYGNLGDIECQRPSVEVKRDADGVMRYRCGDYWLFSRQARSDQLTQAWPQIHAALASRVTR